MVDTAIKSDPKLGPSMLTQDESQYWGNHTIGPKNHGKCKEVFHGAVKEHQVKVLCKIVALCEPVRGEQDDFSFAIRATRKHWVFFYVFKFFLQYRAVKKHFFVMFLGNVIAAQ